MNGIVECSQCGFEDQYVNALAVAMHCADPVPLAFRAPRVARRPVVVALSTDRSSFGVFVHDAKNHLLAAFRAMSRSLKAPETIGPRRFARGLSTIG
jgi:hypothetical protein